MQLSLSYSEAFEAMKDFLDKFYQKTKSDDVGSLLGDLSLLSDGCTADPAAWDDWLNTIKKVALPGQAYFSSLDSYKAMLLFLIDFSARAEEKQVFDLLAGMQLLEDNSPKNSTILADWMESVNQAKKGKKGMLQFQE